jgi:nitrite reductase (NADH) small subunit
MTWVAVCSTDRLEPGRGVAVRLGHRQVALFRYPATDELFALDNLDPTSGAFVMSRGLVGDSNGEPKVCSPITKRSFSLRTGRCLDEPAIALDRYDIRLEEDLIFLCLAAPESP